MYGFNIYYSAPMSSIEQILKKRNIEPKPSHFLVTYQSNKGRQEFFDPKDRYGDRLSGDWQTSQDTISSVGFRKLKNNVRSFLNPDTYSAASSQKIKHWVHINQSFIYLTTFVVSIPLIIFLSRVAPAIRRAKRQYVLHQYMRRRYFEEQFKLGSKKISRREVQDILRETHSKINV